MPDHTLAGLKTPQVPAFSSTGKSREKHHLRRFAAFHLVDHTLLSVDQRRQFRQQHATDSSQIALALQHSREPRQIRLEPVLLRVAISSQAQVVDHGVDVVFQFGNLTTGFDLNRPGEVALSYRSGDLGNGSDLVRQIIREQIDISREVFPRAGSSWHIGLSTETAFDSNLAGDRRHLIGKSRQGAGHVVDGFRQSRNLTFGVHRQLLCKFAIGDRSHDLDDAAYLLGQIRRHDVHVVREILPRAGHAGYLRLPAQLAFRAHLARDPGYFCGERVQLIHHGVDGVLELENFSLDVDRDLARQIAASHGRGHLGDIAHLSRKVPGHRVDGVSQIFPRASNSRNVRLSAQPAFAAHLARHAGYFAGERVELIDHGVDGVLQQQNFAADVHRDFLGEIAAGDGGGDLGDVTHLTGQVTGHGVDGVSEIFPGAADARHLRLPSQFAVGAHFARHARHF